MGVPKNESFQEWEQSSNPLPRFKNTDVTEYQPLHIPYTDNAWGGLQTGVPNSAMKGSTDDSWFYSVGAVTPWVNNGEAARADLFPGPTSGETKVELWIIKACQYRAHKQNMHSFIPSRDATELDCKNRCSAESWCVYSEFDTTGGGSCFLFDCFPEASCVDGNSRYMGGCTDFGKMP